jgi:hypothetical protein
VFFEPVEPREIDENLETELTVAQSVTMLFPSGDDAETASAADELHTRLDLTWENRAGDRDIPP